MSPPIGPSAKYRKTVGTPSVDGVDIGEDWAVIADRSGPVSFRRRRAGKNLAGDSAAVGHHQLGSRPHAVGARGYARQAHSRGRAHRAGHAAQSHPGARLSRPFDRCGDRFRCFGAASSSTRADVYVRGEARKWAPWHIASNSADAHRAPRRHRAVLPRQRRRQRKNLRAERHAILRRRRGHPELLHDVFFSQRG